MDYEIAIIEWKSREMIPYELLVLADLSRNNIDRYILDSLVYTANSRGQTVGCYVLGNVDRETIKIKNIVVDSQFQRKGIGTILLNDAIEKAKSSGIVENGIECRDMIILTKEL